MRGSRLVHGLAVVAATAAALLSGPLAATAHADHINDCRQSTPTLTPTSQVAKVGDTAAVTATLRDSTGAACAGMKLDFGFGSGRFPISEIVTDAQGTATLRYSSSVPAVDQVYVISFVYDVEATVTWKYPTTLVANPSVLRLSGLKLYLTLSGHLASPLGGLAGQPVTFSAAGKTVCTAVTNARGDASCGGLIPGTLSSILGLGYTASYSGGDYFPSSGHGALIA